jgi:rubrerythrin
VARDEGYEQIGEIFTLTADQEKAHGKRLFKFINEIKENNDDIKVEASAPTTLGTTIDNLKAAIAGETYETSIMYPEFAKIADEEGLTDIANHLKYIAIAEKNHKERYEKLLTNIENNSVFKRGEDTWWVCRECGYIHFGKEAPVKCPSCDHAQAFYQIRDLNY